MVEHHKSFWSQYRVRIHRRTSKSLDNNLYLGVYSEYSLYTLVFQSFTARFIETVRA